MDRLRIEGGRRLNGTVTVHGAKNSALPLLAATLLTKSECVLHNCPNLSDVDVAMRILRHLGCEVTREGDAVVVKAATVCRGDIPEALIQIFSSEAETISVGAKMMNLYFFGFVLMSFQFAVTKIVKIP